MIAMAIAVAFLMGGLVQAQTAPGTVILKGSPMGGVKFDHAKHVKAADNKCEGCHHASKAEKPMKAKAEKCQNCHTKTVAAPMKTNAKAAFHDAMAKKGVCIDCHAKDATKKAPTKCADCHKKENV
jgi:sRNA-binding protein